MACLVEHFCDRGASSRQVSQHQQQVVHNEKKRSRWVICPPDVINDVKCQLTPPTQVDWHGSAVESFMGVHLMHPIFHFSH